jgi:hypothetical protein
MCNDAGSQVRYSTAPLGSRTEQVLCQRLLQPTGGKPRCGRAALRGRFRRRSPSLVVDDMSTPHITSRMTGTAWRQGLVNALICGVGVLLAWFALAFIHSLILSQSISASFRPALLSVWGLAFLAFIGSWIYGRCMRGRILLDCGPHPKRWLFVLNLVLFVFIGYRMASSSTSAPDGFSLAGLVLACSFGVYWLIIAFGRLQVSEHGIWQYWSLLRWSKVGSYHWADDSTLLLTVRGPLSILRGALPVAPEHRQAVDDLLTQFCVARNVA